MSTTRHQPDATEVADLIGEQKRVLGLLIYAVSLVRDERFVTVPFPDARASIGFSRKTIDSWPPENLHPSLSEIRQDSDYVDNAFRAQFMAAISFVGDAIAQHRYFDHAPIVEFVR